METTTERSEEIEGRTTAATEGDQGSKEEGVAGLGSSGGLRSLGHRKSVQKKSIWEEEKMRRAER